MDCKWLPPLVLCHDWNRFSDYERKIYSIFCKDFIDTRPLFEGLPVYIRKEPRVDGWVQTFFHVTSSEYTHGKTRDPDIRRCERIRWIRAFIDFMKNSAMQPWTAPGSEAARSTASECASA